MKLSRKKYYQLITMEEEVPQSARLVDIKPLGELRNRDMFILADMVELIDLVEDPTFYNVCEPYYTYNHEDFYDTIEECFRAYIEQLFIEYNKEEKYKIIELL